MSFISEPPAIPPFTPVAGFSALPVASSVTPGDVYRVSGVGTAGFSFWVSDGAHWRPQNGKLDLYGQSGYIDTGGIAQPLATISNTTPVTYRDFVLSEQLIVPAGMMAPGARLLFALRMMRDGNSSNSTTNASIRVQSTSLPITTIGGTTPTLDSSGRQFLLWDYLWPSDGSRVVFLTNRLATFNATTSNFAFGDPGVLVPSDTEDLEFFLSTFCAAYVAPTIVTYLMSYRIWLES